MNQIMAFKSDHIKDFHEEGFEMIIPRLAGGETILYKDFILKDYDEVAVDLVNTYNSEEFKEFYEKHKNIADFHLMIRYME